MIYTRRYTQVGKIPLNMAPHNSTELRQVTLMWNIFFFLAAMHSIFSMAHRCMRFINALNRMTNAILAVRMGFLWEFRLFITEQIKWKWYLNTLLKFMMIDTITKETHKHQTEGVNKSSIIFMAFVVQLNRNNKISMTCACTWRYISIVEFKHGLQIGRCENKNKLIR